MENYDFSGWATRNNIKCSDGRTILKDAFKHNDGITVPLVWNHQHNEPDNVLGHVLLENRDEGVYAYGKFNETEYGKYAKELVRHGDIKNLSIYANHLQQQGGNVSHGMIREVSLVLAGANPGAYIDLVISHGDNSDGGEAEIYNDEEITLFHADEEKETEEVNEVKEEIKKTEDLEHADNSEETVQDVFNTLSEKQKNVVYLLIAEALEQNGVSVEAPAKEEDVKHADEDEGEEETVEDVFNTLTEKQKNVVYAIIGEVLENKDDYDVEEEGNSQ